MRSENMCHLTRANVDEAVCVADPSQRLLLHAALDMAFRGCLPNCWRSTSAAKSTKSLYRPHLPTAVSAGCFPSSTLSATRSS